MRMIACLLLAALAAPASAETLKFTTEDYPPYNFRDGAGYSGLGYEQVVAIMAEVKAEYSVEMMPWARAIALAESEANHCVFTTARIEERENRFKWVEPLNFDRNVIIAREGSGVVVKNIDEAREFTVGTQRNDFTQAVLERNGFSKIDLATDLKLTLKKLLSGRIDLMPMSERYYKELRAEGNPLAAQFVLTEQRFGIACNLATPDALIARMQAALDGLIKNGTQDALYKKYGIPAN